MTSEPPQPLQDCNITTVGETMLEVKCDARAHAHAHARQEAAHVHLSSPSASFVLSPGASARANLEVSFRE